MLCAIYMYVYVYMCIALSSIHCVFSVIFVVVFYRGFAIEGTSGSGLVLHLCTFTLTHCFFYSVSGSFCCSGYLSLLMQVLHGKLRFYSSEEVRGRMCRTDGFES